MTWLQHHTTSEQLAADAEIAGRGGDVEGAQKLYTQAGKAEELALADIKSGKSRTRGILVVSAVSFYYKAAEFQTAEALGCRWLDSGHLPKFAVDQLRGLLEAVRSEPVRKQMEKLRLTARVETENSRHTHIAVFQNGGKAGVLCVDTKHAQEMLRLLNGLGGEVDEGS